MTIGERIPVTRPAPKDDAAEKGRSETRAAEKALLGNPERGLPVQKSPTRVAGDDARPGE